MAAYVIARINITDPEAYEEYRKVVPATIAKFGGKFIARGGKLEILEGEVESLRTVILEFPTMEDARNWYNSQEYAAAKAMRQKASVGSLILVEGV